LAPHSPAAQAFEAPDKMALKALQDDGLGYLGPARMALKVRQDDSLGCQAQEGGLGNAQR